MRITTVLTMSFLLIVVSACGDGSGSESDAIRRIVIAHELDEQGIQVDELIVRLLPDEFRADLWDGGRTVWLTGSAYQRQLREAEYFKVRDPERTYLLVQDIASAESPGEVSVGVVLYLGSGASTSKEITLHKTADSWEVSAQKASEVE